MIVRMTLISGFLTTACSLAALITYGTMPDTLIFLSVEFLLTKLYINSFLAMLNARQSVRDRDTSPSNTLSKIMNIRTAASRVVTSGGPYESEDSKNTVPLSPLSRYSNVYDSNSGLEAKTPIDSHPNSPLAEDMPTHPMERYRGASAV